MPKVSICIPTYQRPDLLKVAVDSCLAQTFQDCELIISDDSPDTRTEEMVRNLSPKHRIRYLHNVPGLGQARNVNQLFSLAAGEFLVLLHDDNFLMPSALEDLLKCLEENPTVVASFGKDYLAANDGTILDSESELVNRRYSKTDDRADRVQRSAWSVLAAQFPPDGYMVRTAAARKTLYRDDPDIGEACDGDFGCRLAELGDFFFVGKYLHAYRITEESISSGGLRILLSKLYFVLQKRTVPDDLEGARRDRLRDLAPVAVNGCLLMSDRNSALKILIGPNYPWKREFIKGAIQLALAFAPKAATEMIINRNSQHKEKTGLVGGVYST
jgi:glycosyltransferase involved in cell wall biosynthesis